MGILKSDDCTIERTNDKYAEVILAGNSVPESVIEKELPKKENPFHGIRILRLIEKRGKLQKSIAEWYAMSKRINESTRSDRRAAKRKKGLGTAEWKQIRASTRKF